MPTPPHAPVREMRNAAGQSGVAVGSIRRGHPARAMLLESLGALHVHGLPIDWKRACRKGRRVTLPTYAWERERYWLEAPGVNATRAQRGPRSGHPLLGPSISLAATLGARVWESVVDVKELAWLLDHQYSPAGLSFSSLKGADAAKSKVLMQAWTQLILL